MFYGWSGMQKVAGDGESGQQLEQVFVSRSGHEREGVSPLLL